LFSFFFLFAGLCLYTAQFSCIVSRVG
jgi:hypothetical protein